MSEIEKFEECRQKLAGAYITKSNDIIFRLYTFPDVTKVIVQIYKEKSQILSYEMHKTQMGLWEFTLKNFIFPQKNIRYRFELHFENGMTERVRDPYSMWQDSYSHWSILYNQHNYLWNDNDWLLAKDKNKISRIADDTNKLKCPSKLSIYELHIGTFTKEGTFESAKKELPKIKSLGFNAIEIMPVENTYSFNWGYDGVDKFAPNHTYGTPDDLKSLIDFAHSISLNVIMDIVPNHLGPDIADLQNTSPYINGCNDFGYKFDFERTDNCFVRKYITDTALNWLVNYHCDGLRVDMTKYMQSDYTMKMMASEVQFYFPHAFLIAEDGRDNDRRVTSPLSPKEQIENCTHHKQFINKICENNVSLDNLGFDSEWDFPFHKQIASAIIGRWEHFVSSMQNLDYVIRNSSFRVKYPMSHDEIGNLDGTRLLIKIFLYEAKRKNLLSPFEINDCDKIYSHCAYNIIKNLSDGSLEKMDDNQLKMLFADNLFDCTLKEIESLYYDSVQKIKLALGKVYSCPGPKMIFQGEESINYSYFKFFRKFSTGSEKCLLNKGYKPGLKAFEDSKMSNNIFDEKHQKIYLMISGYMHDLNLLNSENDALTTGKIQSTVIHTDSNLHAIHCIKDKNEIFSVSNFSNADYDKNYGIVFPGGEWQEILNSNDTKYYGNGQYTNGGMLQGGYNYISLPPYSILFFKKI